MAYDDRRFARNNEDIYNHYPLNKSTDEIINRISNSNRTRNNNSRRKSKKSKNKKNKKTKKDEPASYKPCPECNTLMNLTSYMGYPKCPSCGHIDNPNIVHSTSPTKKIKLFIQLVQLIRKNLRLEN